MQHLQHMPPYICYYTHDEDRELKNIKLKANPSTHYIVIIYGERWATSIESFEHKLKALFQTYWVLIVHRRKNILW